MQLTQGISRSLTWISIHWTELPAESTILEQVKSCGSISCLINLEPLELLRLQPSELIASESAQMLTFIGKLYQWRR